MKQYLYKFHFNGSVHLGREEGRNVLQSSDVQLRSDTLFAALCVEAARGDAEKLNRLVGEAQAGRLLVSDGLPFRDGELFLPKPILLRGEGTVPMEPKQRKQLKKIPYIPLSKWDGYLAFLQGAKPLDQDCADACKDLYFLDERTCAAVRGKEDTDPYLVNSIRFNVNCGLYVLLAFETEELRTEVESLLESLSVSGVGGKRSTGFGIFHLECCGALADVCPALYARITKEGAAHWITLNTALPADGELEEVIPAAAYTLCRRGGFVDGMGYKKRTIYAFAAGSCFKKRFSGEVANVAPEGCRPAYRLLKPIFLGVDV